MIIEFIYLKHKKQSKQHLSEDDDPVVRTENIQCETCIQQLGLNDQTREHSTISKSSDSKKNKSKNDVIVCVHAFILTDDEMLHAELSKTWCNTSSRFQCESAYDNQICG